MYLCSVSQKAVVYLKPWLAPFCIEVPYSSFQGPKSKRSSINLLICNLIIRDSISDHLLLFLNKFKIKYKFIFVFTRAVFRAITIFYSRQVTQQIRELKDQCRFSLSTHIHASWDLNSMGFFQFTFKIANDLCSKSFV